MLEQEDTDNTIAFFVSIQCNMLLENTGEMLYLVHMSFISIKILKQNGNI